MNEELKKPYVPARVAEVNAQIAASPLAAQGISQAPSEIITANSLQSTPPLILPTAPPSTLAAGALAEVASQGKSAAQLVQDNFTRELDAYKTEQQSKTSEQEGKVRGLFSKILGVQGEQSQLEEKAGIPKLNTEVAEINARIESAEGARIAEIAALEGQNLTASGSQSAQAGINRKYAIQQLAEGIMLNAKTRNLTALQSNIDRKIELRLEPLEAKFKFETSFLEDNRKNLSAADEKLFNARLSETERRFKNADETLRNVGEFAKTVAANGAPAEVISAVANAKTVAEAVQAAGQYAGDILDKQYKQAQLDNIYSQINERKQAAIDKANTLPGPVQSKVQGIAGQFDNEQIVKDYNSIVQSLDTVKNAGATPTDDIQRVYAFAKVMDPNSAVKEGEYDTIQEYSTAVMERVGLKAKRVFDNTGFLTPQARTFLENTLENRFKSTQKAYDNVFDEYGRRINKVTGKADGSEYITDYRKAFVDINDKKKENITIAPDGTEVIIID